MHLQQIRVWTVLCALGMPLGCGNVHSVASRARGDSAGGMADAAALAGAGGMANAAAVAGGAGGAAGGAAGAAGAGATVGDCPPGCEAGQSCVRGECVRCSQDLAPPFAYSDPMAGGNSVTIADFSGDGRPDLAYTDLAGLNFELGSDAGLQPQPLIAVPNSAQPPIIAAHADLDRDGSEDLVVGLGTDNLQVFWGGQGGSSETTSVALAGQVSIGDFDDDKQLDLAVYREEKVTIAWGRPSRSFEIGPSSPALKGATRLVAGDLNRDGKLDLTLAAPAALQAFVGDGSGKFTAQTVNDAPGLRDFALKDLDGDGRLDLVTSRAAGPTDEPWATGYVAVQYTFSGVLLGDTLRYQAGSGDSLVISDVNGDDKLDIVATNLVSRSADVLLGFGDGSFAGRRAFGMGPNVRAIALGDLNGDKKPDLASVGGNVGGGRRVVAYNQGAELFAQRVYPMPPYGADHLRLLDVTGDGYVDALVSNLFGNSLLLLAGTPTGTLDEPEYLVNDISTGGASPPLAIADFHGDGRLEIAMIRKDELSLFRRTSSNHFEVQSSSPWSGQLTALVAGDLNEDGNLDLVATSTEPLGSPIRVRLGLGSGEFGASSGYGVGGQPSDAFLEDMNHDQHLDLVLADSASRSIFVMNGRGDGTFDAPISSKTGGQPLGMQHGDLNADGWSDVVVTFSGSISVLLGSARGLQPEVVYVTVPPDDGSGGPAAPAEVALADFDGDGRLDVAAIEDTSPGLFVPETEIAILHGRGDGTLLEPVRYPTYSSPFALVAADLNGDGKPDLASLNRHGETLSILSNHSTCGE